MTGAQEHRWEAGLSSGTTSNMAATRRPGVGASGRRRRRQRGQCADAGCRQSPAHALSRNKLTDLSSLTVWTLSSHFTADPGREWYWFQYRLNMLLQDLYFQIGYLPPGSTISNYTFYRNQGTTNFGDHIAHKPTNFPDSASQTSVDYSDRLLESEAKCSGRAVANSAAVNADRPGTVSGADRG